MIIVDIEVPILDTVYNFSVAEDTVVEILIDEIAEMICQREKLVSAAASQLELCDAVTQRILPKSATLIACGVDTGHRLLLV